jgi:hypothetical protein
MGMPRADNSSSGAQVPDQRPETGERRTSAWQCPTCGRHVPRHVDACRCGSERRRLEALGYKFDSELPISPTPSTRARQVSAQDYGLAGTLLGYQLDTDLPGPLRVGLRVFFGAAVIALVVALVRYTHGEPLPTRDNIHVLSTLDAFTRNAGPEMGNTIPTFISSAGRLGVLTAAGTPEDLVRSIAEADLRQGFCSQSVVNQVRHEYPGFYDTWPNDKLERMVLEKYPEFADRVCVLSVRFDAPASDVIKYELKPRTIAGHALLWLRTLLIASAFAVVCLNVYYRMIVARVLSPVGSAA